MLFTRWMVWPFNCKESITSLPKVCFGANITTFVFSTLSDNLFAQNQLDRFNHVMFNKHGHGLQIIQSMVNSSVIGEQNTI